MEYLLDTQAIIWFINGDVRLPQKVQDAVKDTGNAVDISIVSLWEIAIKRSIGKLTLATSLQDIQSQITARMVNVLPLTVAQLET
jgi:PIN domain nuclease of toxin-antitoxin system